VAPQLACRFGQPVQPSRRTDTKRVGAGKVGSCDKRKHQAGFGEFLLGVVQEARVGDGRVWREGLLRFGDRLTRLGCARSGVVELLAVDGADRAARSADRATARGKRYLPSGVRVAEVGANGLRQSRELLRACAPRRGGVSVCGRYG
jgi:hypothetical protein